LRTANAESAPGGDRCTFNLVNVIIVMGVSGAGKTAVGQALATSLGWPFHEGDDYHPPRNVEKMSRGQALTDDDRAPWLDALAHLIHSIATNAGHGVLACSALKHQYRKVLVPPRLRSAARFVYLDVPREVLRERLAKREHHFAPPELLDSQLATLEEPRDALRVDGNRPIPDVVRTIREALNV
jgi:gluconokinase